MALTICTWLWGNKYSTVDVAKLVHGLQRHLKQHYRFFVVTDKPGEWSKDLVGVTALLPILDKNLLRFKGCLARLRMFDPDWQASLVSDRIVCIDLDTVIVGPLDPLFDRPEPFVILQKVHSGNPCPYNGSLWMLRAGYRPDVWKSFSLEAADKIPRYEFPDDQGWMAHKIPGAAAWTPSDDGVYAFEKPGWPKDGKLPHDARMVVFPGWRSPQQFKHLPWIKKNWIA